MPLFTRSRDAAFVKHIQREMMQKITSVEVGVYKLMQEESNSSLYMEINQKSYTDPIRIYSMPLIGSEEIDANEFGVDSTRDAVFGFIAEDLSDADIYIEEGDVIEYDGKFYQISKVSSSNYWSGRNPENSVRTLENEDDDTGYETDITCEAFQISEKDLLINDKRYGYQEIEHFGDYTNLI